MIQAMFGFFLMLLGLVFFTRGAGDYYKNKPINANLNLPEELKNNLKQRRFGVLNKSSDIGNEGYENRRMAQRVYTSRPFIADPIKRHDNPATALAVKEME